MAYTTIPASSSSNAAGNDWYTWGQSIFVAKTGLSQSQYAMIYRQDFIDGTNVALSGTYTAAGTGAVQSSSGIGTGIVIMQGPSSGTGSIKWWQGPTPEAVFPQLRQKRWMIWMRIGASANPDSHSVMMCGANNAGVLNTFGVGYVGAASTWHYVRNSVQGSDLGVNIDGSGASLINCYVANFDLTNVVANANPGVVSDTTCEAITNLVNGSSFLEMAVAPSGTVAQQDKLIQDAVALFTER